MTLNELQEVYLESRSVKDFENLYRSVLELSKKLVLAKLKGIPEKDPVKVEQFAIDATSAFMMMYVKSTVWKCTHFPARVGLDVYNIIHDKRKKGNDRYFYDHTRMMVSDNVPQVKKPELDDIMDVLQSDRHRKPILMVVYKTKTLRAFLYDVSEIKSVGWVVANIKGLKQLYHNTRLKNG